MSLLRYRAFATEVIKIATDLTDAGIRKLLAERKGEPYLPGGELESNADPGSIHKLGTFSSMLATQVDASPLSAGRTKPGKYHETRDWANTALKGATGGVGAAGLGHALVGIRDMPLGRLRAGAGIGTAIALGDRAYRLRAERKHDKGHSKPKTAMVDAAPRSLKSPATSLATARKTGGFKSGVVHNLSQPSNAVQIGQKFRLP